jgi:hypothetical protein
MISITVPVVIAVPVPCRSPPAIIGRPPAECHPSIRNPKRETPTGIGIPVDIVSVGYRPGVVIGSIPWPVIISGTIVDTSMVDIGVDVPGGISDIHNRRGVIINVDIFHIIDW